jgi:hypothetical protein
MKYDATVWVLFKLREQSLLTLVLSAYLQAKNTVLGDSPERTNLEFALDREKALGPAGMSEGRSVFNKRFIFNHRRQDWAHSLDLNLS